MTAPMISRNPGLTEPVDSPKMRFATTHATRTATAPHATVISHRAVMGVGLTPSSCSDDVGSPPFLSSLPRVGIRRHTTFEIPAAVPTRPRPATETGSTGGTASPDAHAMATPAPIAAGAATMAIPAARRTQEVTANAVSTSTERMPRVTCARSSAMGVTPRRGFTP
ncbi:MAG: hypothetical protein EBT09_02000 [Actinobacteria bacterium]|nr:hypothetical protein [Actinomycetota bacterium]